MPRPKRIAPGGYCYHVLNRGNGRQEVFHKPADYAAFVGLFDDAQKRCPMRVLAHCLMPNHFHLVLWPRKDGELSRWMQWLQTTHVRRYHEHYHASGHVWQGRFKAFPIEDDEHLLTVLRYVERNPLRAGLVTEVDAWLWSSLSLARQKVRPAWYSDGPVQRGREGGSCGSTADRHGASRLAALRESRQSLRQRPLDCTYRHRTRPRKHLPPPRPPAQGKK